MSLKVSITSRCWRMLRWSPWLLWPSSKRAESPPGPRPRIRQTVQTIISQELGIPKENVVCHVTLLGGGFGRKSKPDYVAEAAVLSKKLGRPVKVVWTREDDIKFDYYNAVAAMYLKASLDAKGNPTAWLQRSVFPPIPSIFE